MNGGHRNVNAPYPPPRPSLLPAEPTGPDCSVVAGRSLVLPSVEHVNGARLPWRKCDSPGGYVTANLAALTGLLIGGEWTGGRGGRQLPVVDPATEDVLTDVADATAEDALDAVAAA